MYKMHNIEMIKNNSTVSDMDFTDCDLTNAKLKNIKFIS